MNSKLKPSRLQVFSFLSSMPIIDFVFNFILFDEEIFDRGDIWLISFPLIFVIGIGSWRTQTAIQNFIQYKYPGLKQTRHRIGFLAALVVPVMSLSVILIFFIYDHFCSFCFKLFDANFDHPFFVPFCYSEKLCVNFCKFTHFLCFVHF